MTDFKHYNHLGFHNPYYVMENNRIKTLDDFNAAANFLGEERILDLTAVTQILNKGYIFGDRTLLKKMYKTPWMAKPNKECDAWDYYDVPNHYEKDLSLKEIGEALFKLLKEEMKGYLFQKKNIGILLTGGMDSRIVACVLNDLIDSEESQFNVTAITWGSHNSRDVVYASRIADKFGWDWQHLIIDQSVVMDNYHLAVNNGCEYSPLHLHAMKQVSNLKNLDCILGGSFGDSIGRGEYSGVKVSNLKSHLGSLENFGGFFRKDVFKSVKTESNKDIESYHSMFPQLLDYQQNEQDYQLHYMRRMLNTCMSIIDKQIPLYQMFSAPSVFGFMWSLKPELRNDSVYKFILDNYGSNLSNIPWARTGLLFPLKNGNPDSYTKRSNDYAIILQGCLPDLKERILSEEISNLHYFNMDALAHFVNLCEKKPMSQEYFYLDKLFWIASLSEFIREYKIKSALKPFSNQQDKVSKYRTTLKYYYQLYR